MKCPVCKEVNLTISERQGVEIDFCPQCRGVWLDRGELDKILDRSGGAPAQAPHQSQEYSGHGQYPNSHNSHSGHSGHSHNNYGHGHKKKESFLSDLFDF